MNTTLRQIARRPLITSFILAALAAGGAYTAWTPAASGDAPPPPPPAQVTVQTLALQKTRAWSEFSGRLHAVDVAEIRPEVGGRITAVKFEDGQSVKAGDVLFVIDPRPYEAAVARAKANVASAQTNAALAKVEFQRAQGLIGSQTIAQSVFDQRANATRVTKAAIDGAEAELKQAELDLEHAYVRAPISGRASRAEITLGNLVQPGANAPLLTTIVGNEWIYADFEVDEGTYLRSVRAVAARREDERRIPVKLTLAGDKSRSYQGTIYSFDNRIDVATGTIRARAKLDNSDGTLLPGMFVSVQLADAAEREALLIPERAINSDQSKKFVFVVTEDNKVAYREVELGRQVQSQRIALKGVVPGDRVIVEGVQHVRPNAVVVAKEAATSSFAQAPAGNAAR
jgi:multidrug efflux system membrane fusion protein